ASPEALRIRNAIAYVTTGQSGHEVERVQWNDRLLLVEAQALTEDGSPTQVLLTVRDHTELERLAAAAAQQQRSENFLQLAGNMLHTVNNSLQVILGHAASIAGNPHQTETVSAACKAITEVVEEAAELTHQAISLKNSLTEHKGPIDLNISVMNALNRVQDILKHGTKIAVSLGNIPPIHANGPTLVNSLELLLRYADALFGTRGALTIQTSLIQQRLPSAANSSPESVCQLSITANLATSQPKRPTSAITSMSAETTPHLFYNRLEKTLDQLGANYTHKGAHSGHETICVRFPAMLPQQSLLTIEPTTTPEVLIVDDDLNILQTVSKVLNDAGYRSSTATNRRAAIQLFKRHSNTLRLVIVDALLPSTHGSSLLRQLKRMNPSIIVVGFSGASAPDLDALLEAGAQQVLRKPLHPNKIVRVVQELLGNLHAA
ncbi:MAG: response regulator, partial [Proteobacteria bacterium]|nr:response regulator [Pseudomonadota bacterium]